jgi:KipI family sensor histidine kinase inhibitor
MEPVRYRPFGDTGLLLEYGHKISPDIHERVMAMTRAIRKRNINGLRAVIPTYASVLLLYEPALTNPDLLCLSIETLAKNLDEAEMDLPRVVRIPVCYEGEFALDMADLSSAWGISPEEAIRIHSSRKYLIYMVGFTPGFAFLGGLDPKLYSPRLKTPRTKVPGGSVGIANSQTGIYSIDSPGGWKIIGRTPLNLFDPQRSDPFLYKPGDQIEFIPISQTKFRALAQRETH